MNYLLLEERYEFRWGVWQRPAKVLNIAIVTIALSNRHGESQEGYKMSENKEEKSKHISCVNSVLEVT